MNRDIYNYWGKTNIDKTEHYPVVYHCLDAAACVVKFVEQNPRLKAMFDEIPLFNKNPGLLPFLIAVHDIGKLSKSFQEKIKDDSDDGYYHTVAGKDFLINSLYNGQISELIRNSKGSDDDKESAEDNLKILLEPIAGHHGRPVNEENSDVIRYKFGDKNVDDADEFLKELIGIFLKDFQSVYSNKAQVKGMSWMLAGICIIADWLSSGNGHFAWTNEVIPISDYYDRALKVAESVIYKTGLVPPTVSNRDSTKELFGFEPRHLQRAVESLSVSSGPNLYIIEESTGSGKTEAALVLAHKLMKAGCGSGIYVALPTMATANAMYNRLDAADGEGTPVYEKLFAGDGSIPFILAHGNRRSSKEFMKTLSMYNVTDYDGRWVYDNNKKSLLATVGVGTIDQVLMSVLPKKHQSMMLLGAVRNIVIIDEVHAYDSYMNKLLIKFLKYHKSTGGSVILLSATLPKDLKQKFVDVYATGVNVSDNAAYPMITSVNCDGQLSEIPVEPASDKAVSVCFAHDREMAENKIIEIAEKGGCVCWIRNTVKDAVDEYQSLKSRGLNVLLFHARYTLGDRLDHERVVLEKFGKKIADSDGKVISPSMEDRKGLILIATQVVEQSLDLDFDYIVSDLAPIDLIIQRAGRLWRHKRDRPQGIDSAVMMILAPELSDSSEDVTAEWYSAMFPGGSHVYAEHGRLWKTESILCTKFKILMPSDARELIDYVYDDNLGEVPKNLRDHDRKTEQENERSALRAQIRSLDLNLGYSVKSDGGKWVSSDSVQTRESEPSVVLELWVSDENRLWYSDDDSNGMLSRVSIPLRKIPREIVEVLRDDLDVLRINLVNEGDNWVINDAQLEKINLRYNRELGVIL